MLFDTLHIGDKVLTRENFLVFDGGWHTNVSRRIIREHTVTRIMKTQAATNTGLRFRLEYGRVIGNNSVGNVYPFGYQETRYQDEPIIWVATPAEEIAALERLRDALMALYRSARRMDGQFKEIARHLVDKEGITDATKTATAATAHIDLLLSVLPTDPQKAR